MPYGINKPSPTRVSKVTSTMPTEGSNELLLPQFLKPSQALVIKNFFIRIDTELYERGGVRQLAKVSNISKPKLFFDWTDTLFIIGYATTLAVYNLNDNTINTIKSDFTKNLTGGVRYGNSVYSCNSKFGEDIYVTTLPTLLYKTQTVDFEVGLTITGGTSGATATIVSDSDGGATGTLTLDNIKGVFVNDEALTDSSTGVAVVNGTMTYTNTAAISAGAGTVPKCEALSVYDKSLVAVNTNNNESELLLSKQNTFTDWDTTATDVGDAYSIIYSFAGKANSSANFQSTSSGTQSYGNVLVGFFADGYAGFERGSRTIGGTVVQYFPTAFEKLNDGGEQNALSTPLGIFFANENGIFLLLANTNGQRVELTEKIKRSRKANFNFTDVDFAWSSFDNRLYVTLGENATTNNLILWFDTRNVKNVVWGEIPYPVSRIFTKGKKVYGSASTSPRVLDMFDENQLDDEGGAIDTEYKQPVNTGSLSSIKDFVQIDVGGDISPGAPYTVKVLGIQEAGGEEVETGISYTWASGGSLSTESELGVAELGKDGFVGTPPSNAPVWSPATGWKKVYGYNSYILQFTSSDKLPATLRYATATISEVREQRQNVLT